MDKSVFPVMFWYPPANTYANWKLAAECGFNVVPFRAHSAAEGRQVLDWLEEFGIQGMVEDWRITPKLVERPDWQETVRQVVTDYSSHPALWGYFMTDEPRFATLGRLGKLSQAVKAADPQHIAYSNLLPVPCSPQALGTIDYTSYVRAYIEAVKPQMLSYDYYTLYEGYDEPRYFQNLEIMRAEALRAGLPFMNIYLSVPHFAYRNPSPEDLRYQVYTSLAYGAKALTYFTYHTPDIENYREAVTDIYGHPTAKYPYVRQINQELRMLGPWLLSLTSTCVAHTGEVPEVYQRQVGSESFCDADGAGRALLVGEFVDEGKLPWILVVNKDRERSAWVTLRIRTQLPCIAEVARSTGKLRQIARDSGTNAVTLCEGGLEVRFWLAPADGRLMRLSDS
ncbi:MAG: hypothetical protein LLG44_03260 [Chloroflexi bacterium]|nr:hypothetical protein [Chloroflexota bacterium]